MTDGQKLLLILGLLYLYDCLVWVPGRAVLFASAWIGRWRASFSSDFHLGNRDGGIGMLNPLPFLGGNFLSSGSPVSIAPAGVCAAVTDAFATRDAQSDSVLGYDEIAQSGTDGKYLVLNGARFARCADEGQAASVLELVRQIIKTPADRREHRIRREIAERFDKTAAAERLGRANQLARRLRWWCCALFVLIYAAAPAAALRFGVNAIVIPVAIAMLLAGWFITFLYIRAEKRLNSTPSHDRFSHVANMVLCPPAAIRAADSLTLRSMSCFHPLVVADLLLGDAFESFALRIIRNLKHPVQAGIADPKALEIIAWHARAQLGACVNYLKEQCSIEADDLLAPPQWDGVSAAYCPRCSAQYTVESGDCIDCHGIKLIPFTPAQKSEVTHEA
ncbi:hypothetical protein LLG95_01065 [bacterium]|nr:hypothetical protein [bacterium]